MTTGIGIDQTSSVTSVPSEDAAIAHTTHAAINSMVIIIPPMASDFGVRRAREADMVPAVAETDLVTVTIGAAVGLYA